MSETYPVTSPADVLDEQVITLATETVKVEKRVVETGRVLVRVKPTAETKEIEVALTDTRADIERVPVGRYVDAYPDVRREGDVTIIPVVDEHPVIVTRLFLREELRLTLSASTRTERHAVTLRSEEADVQRVPGQHTSSNQG